MLASKLFQLLSRPEVQEIVLLVGKPPCALVGGAYKRLSNQLLKEEDVMTVLASARGQEHLAHLADGSRWEYQVPSVGLISVSAVYDGPILKAALKLASRGGEAEAESQLELVPTRVAQGPAATPGKRGSTPARARRNSSNPLAPVAESQQAFAALNLPDKPGLDGLDEPPPRPRRPSVRAPRPGRAPESQRPLEPAPDLLQEMDAPSWTGAQPEPPIAARALPSPPVVARRPAAHGGDLLDQLLGRARELHASDMHVLADRPVMLRIAGELQPQPELVASAQAEQLILARVPAALHATFEQHGSCDFALDHPQFGRFRANVNRQRSGIKLTARPIGAEVPTLQQLGMPDSIASALQHHQGLIVITGPTGHGKTTTLAALVGMLNRDTSHHVITVEDPIEYVHPTARAVISQREVGTHTKTFQAALKGSLREDPDVIVVGELRDTDTVRMALSASETGHLVISTMNTPSAAKAIERLIDLFPPGDQPQVRMMLAGGLRMVISQRLLPTADRTQLCAAAEVLPGNTPLWALIRENRTYQIASLQQRGKSLGITRLDESLALLVREGRTTLEIAREYAESPEQLEQLIKPRAPAALRPEAAENSNDGNLQKRGMELGKQVFSRAGKLFGGESK